MYACYTWTHYRCNTLSARARCSSSNSFLVFCRFFPWTLFSIALRSADSICTSSSLPSVVFPRFEKKWVMGFEDCGRFVSAFSCSNWLSRRAFTYSETYPGRRMGNQILATISPARSLPVQKNDQGYGADHLQIHEGGNNTNNLSLESAFQMRKRRNHPISHALTKSPHHITQSSFHPLLLLNR